MAAMVEPVKRRREEELYASALESAQQRKKLTRVPLSSVPAAPTFYPTRDEFLDPLKYIEAIRTEAQVFGICKIVPPDGWKMPCEVDFASDRKIATKKQRVDLLGESMPFADGKAYTIAEFETMANAFFKRWLKYEGNDPPPKHPAKPEEDAAAGESSSVEAGGVAAAPGGQGLEENDSLDNFDPLEDLFGGDVGKMYAKLEEDYWRLVDGEKHEKTAVAVEYGNDMDVKQFWSGFPILSDAECGGDVKSKLAAAYTKEMAFGTRDYFARSGWNLNNIARWPGSVLRRFDVSVPGVNSPWLYLGMLFATFSWHNEDNYLASVNYHHTGAPKQWYGVPGASSGAFENVVRRVYKDRLEEIPDMLHHMNTQLSPSLLKANDVPVYKVRQDPGQFVVTFPQSFHSGFSYGYNCGEAVNFATSSWINHAKAANERYRRLGRLAVLGHDRLIFTLAASLSELDMDAVSLLKLELQRIIQEDLTMRPRIYATGVRDISKLINAPPNKVENIDTAAVDYDDKRVCAVCRHTCFLSAVGCNCSQSAVSCLRHVQYLCKCPPTNKYLIEWESKDSLEKVLATVEDRAAQLSKAP